jgi:hypothetical protein
VLEHSAQGGVASHACVRHAALKADHLRFDRGASAYLAITGADYNADVLCARSREQVGTPGRISLGPRRRVALNRVFDRIAHSSRLAPDCAV